MTRTNKMLQFIEELSEGIVIVVEQASPFLELAGQYYDILEAQKRIERQINILCVKHFTLGLTYMEWRRLEALS
jgi:hypothetical protein